MNGFIDASARFLIVWIIACCGTFVGAFRIMAATINQESFKYLESIDMLMPYSMMLTSNIRSLAAAGSLLLLSGLIIVVISLAIYHTGRRFGRWIYLPLAPVAVFAMPVQLQLWRNLLNITQQNAHEKLFPLHQGPDSLALFFETLDRHISDFDNTALLLTVEHWWIGPVVGVIGAIPGFLGAVAWVAAAVLVVGPVLLIVQTKELRK